LREEKFLNKENCKLMEIKKIVAGGSAADPPHLGHVVLLTHLLESRLFDRVIWILSGNRNDKQYSVTPDDRVAMTELCVGGLRTKRNLKPTHTELIIRYTDVYYENTPTMQCIRNLRAEFPGAEITWYTGSDSVTPRFNGKCEIEAKWGEGKELMKEKFLILPREDYKLSNELPPNFEIFNTTLPNISSTEIRERIQDGRTISHLVIPDVEEYIKTHQLYIQQSDEV